MIAVLTLLPLQVLSDEEKRRMYDVTGHSEYTQMGGGGGAGGGAPFTTMRAEEIFRQFFGGDNLSVASGFLQLMIFDIPFAFQPLKTQIKLLFTCKAGKCLKHSCFGGGSFV